MKLTINRLMFSVLLILFFLPVGAEQLNPKENEIVFEAHGIVCSFCSKGVQKKLSKLSFVDKSKFINGVHVAIEEQRVTLAIKPGQEVNIQAAFNAIKSGGYNPIKAAMLDENRDIKIIEAEK